MGAATLFTVTVSEANVAAQGPKALVLKTMPSTLGANPEAITVTRLHGERAPGRVAPPALSKLPENNLGAGGMMVSVKVWERLPMTIAVTVTVPGVAPAVTVIFAWPLASVSTETSERVAVPLETRKPTNWFDTGWPLVPLTCTISGAPKGCPDRVVCRSPDTYAREAIWTLVERLKVVEMALFPARAARAVIGPDALGAKVTVVCA